MGMRDSYILKRTEILIAIVNEDETKGFLKFIGEQNFQIGKPFTIDRIDVTPMIVHGYHICFFSVYKVGSVSMITALGRIAESFKNLKYIVNIGCCASKEKQVKDIVICAKKIFDADTRKEDIKTKYYGIVNEHLYADNSIETFVNGFKEQGCQYLYKPIISSSAIVKNKVLKKKYLKTYPVAVGIEMEGFGLSSYALSKKVEWMLIKGTSDNGVKKNGGEGQEKATILACKLFFGLLEHNKLEKARPSIFISGAVAPGYEFDHEYEYKQIEKESFLLGKTLLEKNYKIINGLGLCVGTSLLASAYDYCLKQCGLEINDVIETLPFPRMIDKPCNDLYRINRKKLIEKSLISIFVFGDNNKKGKENGMHDEYEGAISCYLPRFVIPYLGYYSEELSKKHLYSEMEEIVKKECKKINVANDFETNLSIVLDAIEIMDKTYYG